MECVSTHSRPKAAEAVVYNRSKQTRFQHTAARRRLKRWFIIGQNKQGFNTQPPEGGCKFDTFGNVDGGVSTHSRPKAADG